MQTQWRGPTRGIGMPGYQQSRRIINLTSDFLFMSSCKSHENVVQGHLVTLGPGEKDQMEQQYFTLLALIGVYIQFRYGNMTKTSTEEGFLDLTHQ